MEHHSHVHEHDTHTHDHHHKPRNVWETIASALHLPGFDHAHSHIDHTDAILKTQLGIRALKLALLALGITTLLQVIIYLASGSVALLADTVHNLGDGLNSVPLWIAFVLAGRAATKRFTYGYGRAEDIAGLLIVVSIAFSAGYILIESIRKFINPVPLDNLGWVALAALIGFLGNELVALMQIRVGKQIGSEAMVADGRHARVDGLTSLSVLLAVVGAWLGYPIVDPIVGVLIGIAIVFITRNAIVSIWYRMMDAVEPEMVDQARASLESHSEVKGIDRLRMRWLGHNLQLEAVLTVNGKHCLDELEVIRNEVRHDLYHTLPYLSEATLVVQPDEG
jgi:cation diffusion facilitator family transporter